MPNSLTLQDLIAPLSVSSFIAERWVGRQPYVSEPRAALVERIRTSMGLHDVASVLSKLKTPVLVIGPEHFRASVPAGSAMAFYQAGYSVYITEVETSLEGVAALFTAAAAQLGFPEAQVGVEALAARAGGVSRRHFDHDINFQILLEGEKVWRFEENRHIVNPLRSYHPGRLPDLFSEEAYAGDTSFSTEFDSARETRLTARPGSVVFFPRGYWHEVQSLTDTWSINFIVRGLPWSDAIGSALAARLKRMPQFREYHRFSTDSGHIESSSSFAQLQAEAIKALGEMNADEVTLSQLTVRYRWAETSSPRSVVVRDGRIELHLGADTPIEVEPALKPPLEKISGFQRSFSWHDALAVAGGIEPMGLYNLLEQLVEFGSLVKERRSPP